MKNFLFLLVFLVPGVVSAGITVDPQEFEDGTETVTITTTNAWAMWTEASGDACAWNSGGNSQALNSLGCSISDTTYNILFISTGASCYGAAKNYATCKGSGDYLGEEIEICVGTACGSPESPPIATSTYSTSTVVLYYDWLYMESLQLFCLFLMTCGILFAAFKKPGVITGKYSSM